MEAQAEPAYGSGTAVELKPDNTLFVEERKKRIVELLRQRSKVLVPDLCRMFNISPATARNDLKELSNAGLIHRTHGGAIVAEQASFELTTVQKVVQHVEEKQAIAKYASSLIQEGDSIALDTGTTAMELARRLCSFRDLTILLNDIEIALFLENNSTSRVVLVGGRIRRGFHCTIGSPAIREISRYSVDKAFIAANAVNGRNGLATPDLGQAEVKRAFMGIALQTIVVVDASKLGRNCFAHFAPLEDINTLVTDNAADPDEVKAIMEHGVEVVQVRA